MKKCFPVLLALLLLFSSLALCEADLTSIHFSADETRAMSNFMNMGRYVSAGGRLWGRSWENNLFSAEVTVSRGKPNLNDVKIHLEDNVAVFFCELDGGVFCCVEAGGSEMPGIIRVDEQSGEMTRVYEGVVSYLQVHGGMLYFTNGDHAFCRIAADGSSLETLLPQAVYYPYFIADDLLLYQNDGDGEKLHLMDFSTGEDRALTTRRTYCHILHGSTLYFCYAPDGQSQYRLGKLDLLTMREDHASFYCGNSIFSDGKEIWFADDGHFTPNKAWKRTDVKNYDHTRLSFLFATDSYYIRYGWKNDTTTISKMQLFAAGTARGGIDLKTK